MRNLQRLSSGIMLTWFLVSTSWATDFYTGHTIEVAEGDTLVGDLYAAGESIFMWGLVQGDIIATGRAVELSGSVGQDFTAGAERVTINGIVGDDVRAAGRIVTIHGVVGDDVFAAGAEVIVHEDAVILGNLFAAGRVVRVDGTIRGSLQANGDDIYFGGEVGGDVTLKAGKNLVISPSALVYQNLTYSFRDSVELASRDQVSGFITFERTRDREEVRKRLGFLGLAFRVWLLIGSAVTGVIYLLTFRGAALGSIAAMQGKKLRVLGMGIAGLFGVPIAAALMILLVITAPAGVVVLGGYMLLLYLGYITAAIFAGDWLMHRFDRSDASPYLSLLLGLGALFLLGLVPYLGILVRLSAVVYGVGGLAAAQFERTTTP